MKNFIREKKIFCGENFLHGFSRRVVFGIQLFLLGGSKKEPVTPPIQMNLNDKNARRYFIQLGNTNFGESDLHITATYSKEHLPPNIEEAEREIKNFLDRVRRRRKKEVLPPLKYMLVTVCKTGKDGEKPVRVHHHIIINGGLDRDTIEDLWRKRRKAGKKKGDKIGFINADRLQAEGQGIAALCTYLTNQAQGKKRWSSSQNLNKPEKEITDPGDPPRESQSRFSASKNLKKPMSRTNNHSFSRRELEKIARNPPGAEYWEKRYPGYTKINNEYSFTAEFNEKTGQWAVYVKLIKK